MINYAILFQKNSYRIFWNSIDYFINTFIDIISAKNLEFRMLITTYLGNSDFKICSLFRQSFSLINNFCRLLWNLDWHKWWSNYLIRTHFKVILDFKVQSNVLDQIQLRIFYLNFQRVETSNNRFAFKIILLYQTKHWYGIFVDTDIGHYWIFT